jgi:hypothetical protein
MRRTLRRLALIVVALCALVAPAASSATSSSAQIRASTSKGLEYLRTLQLGDGEIAGYGGDWSLTSFAAAGVASANIKQGEAGVDARTWYRDLIADPETWPGGSEPPVTEYERASLVVDAAGVDPARVSQEQNLIAQIVARYQTATPGYYGSPSLLNGTVFGLLALDGARTVQRIPQVLLDESIAVLGNNQHTNGGWSFARVEGNEKALKSASEPDTTGAAMAALCGAGVPSSDPAIIRGEEYLESILVASSGAFSGSSGVDTDSNAWAVEGLNTCGIDPQGPQFTTSAGKTPIDFLIAQQLPSGAFKSAPGESGANEYSSQDAVRALAGGGFNPQPAKPTKAKQWLAEKNFSTSPGVHALLTLVIYNGTTALDPCEVRIAPGAAKAKLGKVLEAAESESSPAGCVSSFTAVKGKGAITQINGSPESAEGDWTASIDGAAPKAATDGTAVHLGDTIYLDLS